MVRPRKRTGEPQDYTQFVWRNKRNFMILLLLLKYFCHKCLFSIGWRINLANPLKHCSQ